MSLRVRLTWAFILVTIMGLLLAFFGLNIGMYAHTMDHYSEGMVPHVLGRSAARGWLTAMLRWSLASTLSAFVLAGLVGYRTARRITGPISQLRDAAQQLGLRDLSRRVPVAGAGEIADLGRTFNRMCDRLEAEERSRRQLLADVAHELRHPLAVMQGRLDLVQDGKVPPGPESLLSLQDQVLRLTRIAGDLQDLSLAEEGGLSLQRSRVDLGEVLRALLTDLEPLAAAREVTLQAVLPGALPALVGDRDRLRQALFNLLANAIRYTGPQGQVTVTAWAEAGQVQVQISDTGAGIAPEDLPHIFDRFYRVEKSRSRATGGSGLGLAIVRSLVELHGGQVGVTSRPGEGSCFTVRLPVTGPPGHPA